MGFLKSMDISGSALTAQKLRMDVIAENIANANTTRTANGQPYRRRFVLFGERKEEKLFGEYSSPSARMTGKGVEATRILEDGKSPMKSIYDPSHPDCNEGGYVQMPNVDTVKEMIDMISATRSYEANITAINAFKNMAMRSLDIGR